MTAVIDTPETVDADVTLATAQAAGLRALADMIEQNPDLAPLATTYLDNLNVFYAYSKDDIARIARAGKAHGAKVNKNAASSTFVLTLRWGPVGAETLGSRGDVCERVVTAVEVVEEEVPDPEALAAVPTITQTREVETVEWHCGSVLAAESATAKDVA